MFSVYACGCVKKNVSCVSRCEEHERHVVSTFNLHIPTDHNKKTYRTDNTTIVYDDILTSLNNMRDKSVSLICTYPNQTEFWAREECGTVRYQDKLFKHYYRLLNDNGYVVLLVESNLIMPATYAAHEYNFIVHSITSINTPELINVDCYVSDSSKFAIVLSKSETPPTVPKSLFSLLRNVKGTVLDTSCFITDIVLQSSLTNRTIGLCCNIHHYNTIVSALRKR